ncbi:hypothetical protein ABID16_001019 [Rhizobium aquaticum]|uniref:DUF6161 domain-containing protein n=1 Tax=Rhizobium aquaticum TaxID=1549636 RepID=A0ABV2IYJ0_9HYPH
MDEFLNLLAELFQSKNITYPSSEKVIVRGLAAQQVELYRRLFSSLSGVAYRELDTVGSVGPDSEANQIFQWIERLFQDEPPEVKQNGDILHIASPMPILDEFETEKIIKFVHGPSSDKLRPILVAQMFSVGAASAVLVEAGKRQRNNEALAQIFNGPFAYAFQGQMAAYSAAKSARNLKSTFEHEASEQLSRLLAQIENYRGEFESLRDNQRNQLDVLSHSTEDIRAKAQEIDLQIDQSKDRLTNFEKTIREERGLQSARKSWEARYNEARGAFKLAVLLLASSLVCTILTAYFGGIPLIKALAALDASATADKQDVTIALIHQIGRLIVVSVPIAVALWMLRALMRYFMRSMLLMDDARQRQTMLDTYFLLTEQGRADERDRPLILWALFRQTPGHGPDGIEPPDFTEVIKAGLDRVK